MRLGKILPAAAIIIAAASAIAALCVLLLRPRVDGFPEIWVSRMVQMRTELQDFRGANAGGPTQLLTDSELETWKAEFTIAGSPGSGIVLSNGPLAIKLLSSNGVWSATEEISAQPASLWRYTIPMTSRKVKVRIPVETRSCRITIGYRLPTSRERCNRVLVNLGVWRRLPAIANWTAKLFSSTERWLEGRLEIDPFGSPVSIEKEGPAEHKLRRSVNPELAPGEL
jgi:hypothetical protein